MRTKGRQKSAQSSRSVKKGTDTYFGEHMMFDAYDANAALLWDKKLVRKTLSDLCTLLGVLELGKPLVYTVADGVLKVPGGVTGMIILAESHISIHTFPARGFLSADLYSCRHGLDQKAVADFLKKRFSATDVDITFVLRGKRYGKH